jgi:hypothetical protein
MEAHWEDVEGPGSGDEGSGSPTARALTLAPRDPVEGCRSAGSGPLLFQNRPGAIAEGKPGPTRPGSARSLSRNRPGILARATRRGEGVGASGLDPDRRRSGRCSRPPASDSAATRSSGQTRPRHSSRSGERKGRCDGEREPGVDRRTVYDRPCWNLPKVTKWKGVRRRGGKTACVILFPQ